MTISDRRKQPERTGRTATALALVAWLATSLVPATTLAQSGASPSMGERRGLPADSPDAGRQPGALDYRNADAAVRELVSLTDVAQLRNVFTDQFIERVEGTMAMFGGALDQQTMNIVAEQTRAVVSERIADGDALYSVLAPIYEKHFNLIELNQLVNFYQSPLGQKLVAISPQLLTESLDLGQQWGMSLVPEIVSRVRARLNGASAASLAAEPPAEGDYPEPDASN